MPNRPNPTILRLPDGTTPDELEDLARRWGMTRCRVCGRWLNPDYTHRWADRASLAREARP